MMMDPPSAGDDLGVPGSAVTHSHRAGLSQRARRDGVTWSRTTEWQQKEMKHKSERKRTIECIWQQME